MIPRSNTVLMNARNWTLVALVAIAIFSRLLPHPPNFTALGAASLFAGAVLADRRLAFIVPLLTLWLSDLVLNNVIYSQYYEGFVWAGEGVIWSYLAFALIVLMGRMAQVSRSVSRVVGGSFAAALLFFVLSNFGVWMSGTMYPMTMEGLLACYTAAIPFFGYSVAGNLFFAVALFGAHYWMNQSQMEYAEA